MSGNGRTDPGDRAPAVPSVAEPRIPWAFGRGDLRALLAGEDRAGKGDNLDGA